MDAIIGPYRRVLLEEAVTGRRVAADTDKPVTSLASYTLFVLTDAFVVRTVGAGGCCSGGGQVDNCWRLHVMQLSQPHNLGVEAAGSWR